MIDSLIENLNYSSVKKISALEEEVDNLVNGVYNLIDGLVKSAEKIDGSFEKIQGSLNEIYSRLSLVENKVGSLENYVYELKVQKPSAPIVQATQQSVKSEAIDLLREMHAPKKEESKQESDKPSYGDVLSEFKKKMKLLRKDDE